MRLARGIDGDVWGDPAREYAKLDALAVRRDTHLRYSERSDHLDDLVTEALAPPNPGRVLDVGSGTAAYLRRLRDSNPSLTLVGLDQSEDAVETAADIPGVTSVLGDARALPFADATFDRVVARHMLYHLRDPRGPLREMRRVLDGMDGRCVAVVNHERSLPRTIALIIESAQAEGIGVPTSGVELSAHSDNLAELMASAFERVRVDRHDNALVFDSPRPLIAYAVASASFYGVPHEGDLRDTVVRRIAENAMRWFEDNDGVWRDQKGYSIGIGMTA